MEEQLEKVKLEKDKVVEELHTAKTMVSTLMAQLVCSVVPRGQCQLAENKHTKLQEERLHLEVRGRHSLTWELILSSTV